MQQHPVASVSRQIAINQYARGLEKEHRIDNAEQKDGNWNGKLTSPLCIPMLTQYLSL